MLLSRVKPHERFGRCPDHDLQVVPRLRFGDLLSAIRLNVWLVALSTDVDVSVGFVADFLAALL